MDKDVAVQLTGDVLSRWTAAITREPSLLDKLGEVWGEWRRTLMGKERRWKRVKGPGHAVIATLLQYGWDAPTPRIWLDPTKGVWKYTGGGASELLEAFKETVIKAQWEKASHHYSAEGLDSPPYLKPIEKALRALERGPDKGRAGALFNVIAGGQWGQDRRHPLYVDTPTCQRCHRGVDDPCHRFWKCEANEDIVDKAMEDTSELADTARAECPGGMPSGAAHSSPRAGSQSLARLSSL